MERGIVPDVKKIAVLRANGLGDFVFVIPALEALRAAYPEAEITYLGAPWHTPILQQRMDAVNRALTIPETPGVLITDGPIDYQAQAAFFAQMQAEHFDLAFQMHGGGASSNPFVMRLKPRISLGAVDGDAPRPDRWIPYRFYQHEILRNLEVASLAGAQPGKLEPRLRVLPSDLDEAAPVLEQVKRPFIVVHPGSTDARRMWPEVGYARAADYIIKNLGMDVVLTGVESELAQVERIEQLMECKPVNACGRLSLPGLLGLLSKSQLMLTNNTGPLHLALATGVRAVGLFWSEQSLNTMPLSRERFSPLISWQRECMLCGTWCDKEELDQSARNGCRHNASFLLHITPEQVIEAVEEMLGERE